MKPYAKIRVCKCPYCKTGKKCRRIMKKSMRTKVKEEIRDRRREEKEG